ncbi:MAG: leucine-rich repeat protein [Acetatifactor sp.]|nr:leucine-rich repeat protein [Acetatifactor sp.]
MKRRLLCAAFSITLALSVCCNAVYASELDGMDVSAAVEAADVLTAESGQISDDMQDTEVIESEENKDENQNVPETSDQTPETEESPAGTDETEPGTEEEPAGTDETEPGTEEEPAGTDETEPGTEEEPAGTDETEPGTEETEPGTEQEPAGTDETDPSEELEESGEEISGEEIAETFYVSTGDGWNFAVSGNYATITGYTGRNTSLVIPSVVTDNGEIYVVNAIGPNTFSGNTAITAVTLPDTITHIGESAFYSCENLREINLGTGLTEVGNYAFARSGLHLIAFPENVNKLGEGVLTSCENLGAVEVNCQVQRIPADFVSNCSRLTNVWLGDKVAYIDDRAFANTPMLKALAVNIISQASTTAFKDTGLSKGGTLYCSQSSTENWANASYVSYSLPAMNAAELKVVETPGERKLRLGSATSNAIIFYSTSSSNINMASDWVTNGTEMDFSYFKGSVHARAYMCGRWSDVVTVDLPERKVPAPTFTVKGVFGGRTVTFESAQKGAVIYYSTKGSTDISLSSDRVSNGKSVTFGSYYGSVYAKAYYNGQWSNVSRLILRIPTVNDPIITTRGDKVTIRTTTPDAYIYYTTDGSTPSMTNGKRLSGSVGTITMNSGTVKAIAVRSCFGNSQVVSKTIAPTISGDIKTPSFDVQGIIGGRAVTFRTEQPGATIYYSTSSSSITTSDNKVNNGQTVTFMNYYGTVYARTYSNGQWSNVSRLILRIPVVNKPTVRYDGKKTDGHHYYTISTSTPNALLFYTTDGSTPTPTNGKCIYASSAQIRLDGDYGVLKVIAVRSCFTNSEVLTYYY